MIRQFSRVAVALFVAAFLVTEVSAQVAVVSKQGITLRDDKSNVSGHITAVAVSPNGKLIAWANSSPPHRKDPNPKSEIAFYDIALRKVTERIAVDGKTVGLVFTSDGKTIVSVGGGYIRF